MESVVSELERVAAGLDQQAGAGSKVEVTEQIADMQRASKQFSDCFSGSWLGYHSRVYYNGFKKPPPGAHFTAEWGLMRNEGTSYGSRGGWLEHDYDAVLSAIYTAAGNPDLKRLKKIADEAEICFGHARSELKSLLAVCNSGHIDHVLQSLNTDLETTEFLNAFQICQRLAPQGQRFTRDTVALSQGTKVPPHVHVNALAIYFHSATAVLLKLSGIARSSSSHLQRKHRMASITKSNQLALHDVQVARSTMAR